MSKKPPVGRIGVGVGDRTDAIGQEEGAAAAVEMVEAGCRGADVIDHVEQAAVRRVDVVPQQRTGGLVSLGHDRLRDDGIVIVVTDGHPAFGAGDDVVESVVGHGDATYAGDAVAGVPGDGGAARVGSSPTAVIVGIAGRAHLIGCIVGQGVGGRAQQTRGTERHVPVHACDLPDGVEGVVKIAQDTVANAGETADVVVAVGRVDSVGASDVDRPPVGIVREADSCARDTVFHSRQEPGDVVVGVGGGQRPVRHVREPPAIVVGGPVERPVVVRSRDVARFVIGETDVFGGSQTVELGVVGVIQDEAAGGPLEQVAGFVVGPGGGHPVRVGSPAYAAAPVVGVGPRVGEGINGRLHATHGAVRKAPVPPVGVRDTGELPQVVAPVGRGADDRHGNTVE